MKIELEWIVAHAMADTSAFVFSEWRTSKHPDLGCNTRTFMRANAVRSLRFIWQNGDVSTRTTVAARVACWMRRPIAETSDRVRKREALRLAERKLQAPNP